MPELNSETYFKATSVISKSIGRNEFHIENDSNKYMVASLIKLNKELEEALEMLHSDYWRTSIDEDQENVAEAI